LSFRRGFGIYISGYGTKYYSNKNEATAEEFRNKLSDQITTLTGVKPRIEQDKSSGKYAIYYS